MNEPPLQTDSTWERLIAPAVADFNNKNYETLNVVMAAIPDAMTGIFLTTFLAYVSAHCKPEDACLVIRRIAQHPKFQKFITQVPRNRYQGLFLANLPNLKTRVSLSFFDHPKIRSTEVDYTVRLVDQDARLVYQRHATIYRKQTHTFDCAELLEDLPLRYGMFFLDSSEPDLGSLRVYACWYNSSGMTTTHEKAALGSLMPMLIAPTIVSSAELETHIAITNLDPDKTLTCDCQLLNAAGVFHPQKNLLRVEPKKTILQPLSSCYPDLDSFLAGKPGALYLINNGAFAVYYYFIENKKLGTWQIQHL
jgi:hypothetical protein